MVLAPVFRGMGYPKFRTCIFKSHPLPNMWPFFGWVPFSELRGSWRIKEKIEIIEIYFCLLKNLSAFTDPCTSTWHFTFLNTNITTWRVLILHLKVQLLVVNMTELIGSGINFGGSGRIIENRSVDISVSAATSSEIVKRCCSGVFNVQNFNL